MSENGNTSVLRLVKKMRLYRLIGQVLSLKGLMTGLCYCMCCHMEALMLLITLISTLFSFLRERFVSVPAGSLWNGAFTQNS